MVHKSRGDYFKAAIPMMPEENKAIASFSRTPRCWKIGAAATILAAGNPYPISQVTFSEKGTKITPHTHIYNLEILFHIESISTIKKFQNLLCVPRQSNSENCHKNGLQSNFSRMPNF